MWKSYLLNGMREVFNDALPIRHILLVVLHQSPTMDKAVLLPHLVQNAFSSCSPHQNHNFALYSKRNSDLQNRLNDIENKALLIEVIL